MEELRTAYEQTKAENIKLNDNLETQNKLWKVWLQKVDKDETEEKDKVEEVIRVDIHPNESDNNGDDEEDCTNSEEEDVSARIFQKVMNKNKQTSFDRTSPSSKANPPKKAHACDKCTYTSKELGKLNDHKKNTHGKKKEEEIKGGRNKKQYCHFWNNGKCTFETKN